MANYREETTEGAINKWRRMSHGTVYNEPVPRIEMHDEDRTVLPDGTTICQSALKSFQGRAPNSFQMSARVIGV